MFLQFLLFHQVQDMVDFLIAFFHTVFWSAGFLIMEGRCINSLQMQLFLRFDEIGQGVLVVDFIIGVRVQNHIDRSFGPVQAL